MSYYWRLARWGNWLVRDDCCSREWSFAACRNLAMGLDRSFYSVILTCRKMREEKPTHRPGLVYTQCRIPQRCHGSDPYMINPFCHSHFFLFMSILCFSSCYDFVGVFGMRGIKLPLNMLLFAPLWWQLMWLFCFFFISGQDYMGLKMVTGEGRWSNLTASFCSWLWGAFSSTNSHSEPMRVDGHKWWILKDVFCSSVLFSCADLE
jgi:hypothetical protein